jgi:cytoplasmic iron level regulating protein YaaA (DUF328/UPF0246 family)
MRMIISPAKRMRVDADTLDSSRLTTPVFLADAERLAAWMAAQDDDFLRGLWACNHEIADENLRRVRTLAQDLHRACTPAILAFDGIQYTTMAPSVFERGHFAYAQDHLRILSGLYGVLRPLDAVVPYRLEMGSRLPRTKAPRSFPSEARSLYSFWGARIHDEVFADDSPDASAASHTVVNLASREYARCVTDHLLPGERLVTCVFYEQVDASGDEAGRAICADRPKLAVRATYAKMARGEMVRYAAEIGAQTPEDLRGFDRMGYRLCEGLSNDATYAFVRDRN